MSMAAANLSQVPALIGSHLSIAGGLCEAPREASRLGLSCCQLFTRNQRQWKCRPISTTEAAEFREEMRACGWVDGLTRVVSHGSYLINLASPDSRARAKSVAAMTGELERCEALAVAVCVVHPGAHLGSGVRRGIKQVSRSINEIHANLPGYRVRLCLETTVGAGTTLGGEFEDLAGIRGGVRCADRVGFCLDTCHIVAAGYDCSTDSLAQSVVSRFDRLCGVESIKAIHMNDSCMPCGSRRDRHAHIGLGHCGAPCFRAILRLAARLQVPCILETPKEMTPGGKQWDIVNRNILRELACS